MSRIRERLAEWEQKKGVKFTEHVKDKFCVARAKATREKLTLEELVG